MNEGQFYALPQSPQTFKQLLMVAGMDKYYQIVKCFRDEDLRADRQPEFTQIDCEMSFVEQEEILNMFEGLTKHLLSELKGVLLDKFPRITYDNAMELYGSDKPDIRFDMQFIEMNDVCQGKGFVVFDNAELIVAINVKGCAHYTRKQLDKLVDFVNNNVSNITTITFQEEETCSLYVGAVEDASNKFILRMAYDEAAILDSEYAKSEIKLYSLFNTNSDLDSLPPSYHSSSVHGIIDTISQSFNDPNIPDFVKKTENASGATLLSIGFLKAGLPETGSDYRPKKKEEEQKKEELKEKHVNKLM
jgi:hypothetical protein